MLLRLLTKVYVLGNWLRPFLACRIRSSASVSLASHQLLHVAPDHSRLLHWHLAQSDRFPFTIFASELNATFAATVV